MEMEKDIAPSSEETVEQPPPTVSLDWTAAEHYCKYPASRDVGSSTYIGLTVLVDEDFSGKDSSKKNRHRVGRPPPTWPLNMLELSRVSTSDAYDTVCNGSPTDLVVASRPPSTTDSASSSPLLSAAVAQIREEVFELRSLFDGRKSTTIGKTTEFGGSESQI